MRIKVRRMTMDEEQAVNAQIPFAEKIADKAVPVIANEWSRAEWSLAFSRAMDDLCIKAGLRVRVL